MDLLFSLGFDFTIYITKAVEIYAISVTKYVHIKFLFGYGKVYFYPQNK